MPEFGTHGPDRRHRGRPSGTPGRLSGSAGGRRITLGACPADTRKVRPERPEC